MEEGFVFRGWQLPPGFRFQPTDQEIIVCYLKKKVNSAASASTSIIADVDIYKFDPWELPGKAMFGEGEWFFFSPRERKYPNGARPNRTAGSGYWKATGTDKPILASGGARCLGVKKALVFYQGRSPRGAKTDWVMHEFRLLHPDDATNNNNNNNHPRDSMRLDDWVLCRVRKKGAAAAAVAPDTGGLESVSGAPPPSHAGAIPAQVPDAPYGASGFGDDWTDCQILQYLIAGGGGSGQADGAGAMGESAHGGTLASVLETIKRNLSFEAVDDARHHDQQLPTSSASLSMFEID